MNKIIFHIDIDTFFISVEKILNNNIDIENKPVVIARNSIHGMISTSNYIARKYNIFGGTPLFIAKKKCKNLIILEPHYAEYEKYSTLFYNFLKKYTKNIVLVSLDECYVDFANQVKTYNQAYILAKKIKNNIKKELNLTVSIGISFNLFMAKTANNIGKPNNIYIINQNNYENILSSYNISDIYNIGRSTAMFLHSLNIYTVSQLLKYKHKKYLAKKLGIKYLHIINAIKGFSSNIVVHEDINSKNKSLSLSSVIWDNKYKYDNEIYNNIIFFTNQLVNKIHAQNILIKCVYIKMRLHSSKNKWIIRQKTLNNYSNNYYFILNNILDLYDESVNTTQIIKGIGIGFKLLKDVKYDDLDSFQLSKNSLDKKTLKVIRLANHSLENKLLKTVKNIE